MRVAIMVGSIQRSGAVSGWTASTARVHFASRVRVPTTQIGARGQHVRLEGEGRRDLAAERCAYRKPGAGVLRASALGGPSCLLAPIWRSDVIVVRPVRLLLGVGDATDEVQGILGEDR